MRTRSSFLLGALLLLGLAACGKGGDELTITSPDGVLTVTVHLKAYTDALEQDDALHSQTPSGSGGLLFGYREPQIVLVEREGFPVPLSFLYFDAEGTLVGFEEVASCPDTEFCRAAQSPELAQYAVVLEGGFPVKHGMRFGWRMDVKEAERMVEAKR